MWKQLRWRGQRRMEERWRGQTVRQRSRGLVSIVVFNLEELLCYKSIDYLLEETALCTQSSCRYLRMFHKWSIILIFLMSGVVRKARQSPWTHKTSCTSGCLYSSIIWGGSMYVMCQGSLMTSNCPQPIQKILNSLAFTYFLVFRHTGNFREKSCTGDYHSQYGV